MEGCFEETGLLRLEVCLRYAILYECHKWRCSMQTSTRPRIVSDPKINMGKPTVEGTRITVELILEKLAAGESVE